MNTYKYDIKVISKNFKTGYMEGTLDEYLWFAVVEDEERENCLDAKTLKCSIGKISRLCIYKETSMIGGNPFVPSISVKRLVFVNFLHEWSILNEECKSMAWDLAMYIESRSSIKAIK